MLKRYAQLFTTINFLADLSATTAAFVVAYFARFAGVIPAPRGVPDLDAYMTALPVVLAVYALAYRVHGLYRPRRLERPGEDAGQILRANLSGFLVLLAISFVYREFSYSRVAAILFFGFNFLFVFSTRFTVRILLRRWRARGFNIRYAVVVGAGREGQAFVDALRRNPWTGISVLGFLDDRDECQGRTIDGVPVLGRIQDVDRWVQERSVDQVFVTLPMEEYVSIRRVVEVLASLPVDIRIVSDLFGFASLNRTVSVFDGIPIIGLRESPVYGWKLLVKRLLDITLAGAALVLTAPIMVLISLLIWRTSGWPVLYAQERMGLDCRSFTMYKFRTMRRDAEAQTGPVWAARNDDRVTPLGRLLRRWSLDELPQFWNVLKGDMSLVGPRPERPDFMQEFTQQIPKYALRHKVKAGITGWAQVHDLRGESSLRRRVEYDLYYIENWSNALDLWILAMTFGRLMSSRNAH